MAAMSSSSPTRPSPWPATIRGRSRSPRAGTSTSSDRPSPATNSSPTAGRSSSRAARASTTSRSLAATRPSPSTAAAPAPCPPADPDRRRRDTAIRARLGGEQICYREEFRKETMMTSTDLDAGERMSLDELRADQLNNLRTTVTTVYEKVPFYRRAFDELGVTPADIKIGRASCRE